MRFRLFHKGLILILVPLAFCLGFLYYISGLLKLADQQVQAQLRSATILAAAESLTEGLMDAGIATALFMTTKDPQSQMRHLRAAKEVEASLQNLNNLFADRPDKLELLAVTNHTTARWFKLQRAFFKYPEQLGFMQFLGGMKSPRSPISVKSFFGRPALQQLADDERKIDDAGEARSEKSWQQIQAALVMAVAASIVLTLGLAVMFNRSILNRLRIIKYNIMLISGRGLLLPPVPASDEIGDLDRTVTETAEQVRQLEAYKQRMTALLAGDLIAPLDSIITTINRVCVSPSVGEKGQQMRSSAKVSLERLIRMVSELLYLDRLEQGRLDMAPSRTSVSEVIATSFDAVSQLAREKRIRFSAADDESIVWADKDRLVQVVVNLLSNAIKFSPEASTVSISTQEKDGLLSLNVTDRGRGIPQEFMDQMFGRFAQAYEADAADRKGFGLGLSICKQIIEQHHGTISVQSKVGEGTTFTLTLPTEPGIVAAPVRRRASASARKSSKGSWLTTDARLWQKGLILVGTPLLFQLVFVGVLAAQLQDAHRQIINSQHTRHFMIEAHAVRRTSNEMTTAAALYRAFHMEEFKDKFDSASLEMRSALDHILKIAHPNEREAAMVLKRTYDEGLPFAERLMNQSGPTETFAEAFANPADGLKLAELGEASRNAIADIEKKEFDLTNSAFSDATRINIQRWLLAALVANLLLAGALLIYLNISVSRRIAKVSANAVRLIKRQPLAPPEVGSDEIADISQAFYTSAQKLLELERFKSELVSVVAHDIRTPLATVQNVLTLLNVGALGELPPPLTQEVKAAEEECTRLLNSVNDLLSVEKTKTSAPGRG